MCDQAKVSSSLSVREIFLGSGWYPRTALEDLDEGVRWVVVWFHVNGLYLLVRLLDPSAGFVNATLAEQGVKALAFLATCICHLHNRFRPGVMESGVARSDGITYGAKNETMRKRNFILWQNYKNIRNKPWYDIKNRSFGIKNPLAISHTSHLGFLQPPSTENIRCAEISINLLSFFLSFCLNNAIFAVEV